MASSLKNVKNPRNNGFLGCVENFWNQELQEILIYKSVTTDKNNTGMDGSQIYFLQIVLRRFSEVFFLSVISGGSGAKNRPAISKKSIAKRVFI
jgi:hypothetical protein